MHLNTPLRLLALAGLGMLLLPGCEGANIPLTQDYRDESEDAAARADYYEDAATTYLDGGRYRESIDLWQKVLKNNPNDMKAKWGLARAYLGRGGMQDLKDAIPLLDEVRQSGWSNGGQGENERRFGLHMDLANAYSELAEHYERDARRGERLLETDPNADARRAEGLIVQQRGKRDDLLGKAIPVYRSAHRMRDDNPLPMAGLARAHLSMGNDDLGLHWANKYLARTRASDDFWRERRQTYQEKHPEQMTQRHREFFREKLAGVRTKETSMHLMVGSVHMRRGAYDEAAASYTRVIERDPDMPAPYVERAQAHAALRQYNLAVRDLEHYLKITDPQTHREERVNAAELLDRYQRITHGRGFLSGPGAARPAEPVDTGFMR